MPPAYSIAAFFVNNHPNVFFIHLHYGASPKQITFITNLIFMRKLDQIFLNKSQLQLSATVKNKNFWTQILIKNFILQRLFSSKNCKQLLFYLSIIHENPTL